MTKLLNYLCMEIVYFHLILDIELIYFAIDFPHDKQRGLAATVTSRNFNYRTNDGVTVTYGCKAAVESIDIVSDLDAVNDALGLFSRESTMI